MLFQKIDVNGDGMFVYNVYLLLLGGGGGYLHEHWNFC